MRQEVDFDVVVVGGGIVGLATAYQLAQDKLKPRIAILEKEDALAQHQTGHNSGVIHSGLYYRPGSSKAKTCIQGRKALVAFAEAFGIQHDICGKIVVATHPREREQLERLYQNGQANGIEGIVRIGPEAIREREPTCAGIDGLYVPCAGLIDFAQVAHTLAEQIVTLGSENQILTGKEAIGLERHDFYTKVQTTDGVYKTRCLVNCGGLQCDRIATLDGFSPDIRIVPFRGDYYDLAPEARSKVRNLIYPVPDPRLPFLGVHCTRMLDGSVSCGPNAVLAFRREGYTKTAFHWRDTREALFFSGTWRLFLRHMNYGVREYARTLSKGLFLRQLQRLVPDIQRSDLQPGKSGVRAQAVDRSGRALQDFFIVRQQHTIHVLNAPSPAATACLEIGKEIAKQIHDVLRLS